MEWIASAAFGLEGLVKRDLMRLDAKDIRVLPTGGVAFTGDWDRGFRANMWLRTADRVLLLIKQFQAVSFEELFQGIYSIPWEDFIPKDSAFPIRAQCARSRLMSPSDCQSITKKAIVERLKKAYGGSWLNETGSSYTIDVAIHEDLVSVTMDTSGTALNRRGYRTWNGEAPMRETLAAALALLSPWNPKKPLHDPCCGTGTLLIEAAFIATDRAPGLEREFAMEKWLNTPVEAYKAIREEARERFENGKKRPVNITGNDIDPQAVDLCNRHIKQAGLQGLVQVRLADLRDVTMQTHGGVFLANPPYGERLGDKKVSQAVAKQLGVLQMRNPDWDLCAVSSDRLFEKNFGKRADRRRRLYNGRLECEFMIFNAIHGGVSL